jgi:hypothetical protein
MPVSAVTTAKGANWDHARDIRQQPSIKNVRSWTLWPDGRSRGQHGK